MNDNDIIEFRVWTGKKMLFIKESEKFGLSGDEGFLSLVQLLNHTDHDYQETDTYYRQEENPCRYMQFTGLRDIAKTKCYAGDIVKAVWSENINDETFAIGKIIFNCGCWMIQWIDDPEAAMEILGFVCVAKNIWRPRVFKILGNEFENPELLKK